MIQLELQPELEARLAAQAQARGLALEQYIVETLDASASFSSPDPRAVEQAIENIHSLRKECAALRDAAVEDMIQFAAGHGFTHGAEDFRTTAHEGHKY